MLEKLLTKLVKSANPGRDIKVEKLGKHFFMIANDKVGGNDYLLEGSYTYDEVQELNKLTGNYCCGFGYTKELGPIAFIGICNPHYCTRSGYFEYEVHEYGTSIGEGQCYFEILSDEDAKQIGNYTVYGLMGVEEVAKKVPIAKVKYCRDLRYRCKKFFDENEDKKILEMDQKLLGKYTFKAARLLATGTAEDKHSFTGEEHPIVFAIVGNNKPVGIINFWGSTEDDLKFKDVWEYGCDEPSLECIRFISKEEAEKINEFELYVYICPYSLTTKKYPIEKYDRTFDKRFNFKLPNCGDYRVNLLSEDVSY